MADFHNYQYSVYILENTKALRVKIGMTINDAALRLRSVNDMWLEQKVTCQICGGRRLVNKKGFVPKHVVSGNACPGSGALPLEKDTALAESYLENLKKSLGELSGSEKGSATRITNNLEKRIGLYRNRILSEGEWKINTIFYTESPYAVEQLSHEILADRLDKAALFGEVFCCTVSEASEAVESALSQLGLLESARKEIRNDNTSEEFGKCLICGNNLTERGTCPDCIRRFLS
jgi:hypothetical protein